MVLDRLHTYTIKIVKLFCVSHDIEIINDKNESYPLHSLIGMLSKYYSKNGMVTKFSEIVMRNSISIFEKFNEIRNNRSFAHDNEIISDQEAMFIIKTIMNLLEFLDYVEMQDPNIIYIENLNKEDIYKLICLNEFISTKEIAEHFNCEIENVKQIVLELYKVDLRIKRATIIDNENDDNCKWIKND